MCVDDLEGKKGLQLLTDPAGRDYLSAVEGVDGGQLTELAGILGISGVCDILGAIKTAEGYGPITRERAAVYFAGVFQGAKLDSIQEGDRGNRLRWHNLKYSWWVEQHGRTVAELDSLRSQDFWAGEQAQAAEFDRRLRESSHKTGAPAQCFSPTPQFYQTLPLLPGQGLRRAGITYPTRNLSHCSLTS